MSAAVASVGGVSLQDPAAKEKVKESQAKQQEDNMSMRPNNNMAPKVYNIIIVDPVTGKSVEKVVSQQVYETVTR
jgi:serine/threonine protein phosphatase PrpC